MTLPPNWTAVKVYGTYLRLDGTVNSGKILFDSATPVSVTNPDGTVVLVVPARIEATLDANGYFETLLPATNNPAFDPVGWTYQVKEEIAGGLQYSIDVPYSLVSLNLVPMRPAMINPLIPPTLGYLTTDDLGNTVAKQADLNTTNTNLATASANATAAISTANSASTAASSAQTSAAAAQSTATAANTAAAAAQTTANTASTNASNALTTANTANSSASAAAANAATALSTANTASTTANTASTNASSAVTTANNANTAATSALNTANGLNSQISTANTNATNAVNTANAASTTANGLQSQVTAATNTANSASTTANSASTTANSASSTAGTASTNASAAQAAVTNLANNLAATTSGNGAAMIGYGSGTVKSFLDAGGSGGGITTYSAPGGSTPRLIATGSNPKLADFGVCPLDYYQSSDGSDYYNAVTRALAVSVILRWPPGTFTIGTPINAPEGMQMHGAGVARLGTYPTQLTCPNGFLNNPNNTSPASRKHWVLTNLAIVGNTSSATAINGPWGGTMHGCVIDGFSYGMQNPDAFLLNVVECGFTRIPNIALSLADTNGTTIERCSFMADVRIHISNLDIVATPGSSGNFGSPFYLRGNNHNANMANYANTSLIRLCGQCEVSGNYGEDYTAGSTLSGVTFLEYKALISVYAGLTCYNNLFNAQGNAKCGINIYSSSANPTSIPGSIFSNQLMGYADPSIGSGPIVFGKQADGTNNAINDLRIYHNYYGSALGSDTTQGVKNLRVDTMYRPFAGSDNGQPGTSVAGSTFIALPISTAGSGAAPIVDNAGAFNGTFFKLRRPGAYLVVASVTTGVAATEVGLFYGANSATPTQLGTTQVGAAVTICRIVNVAAADQATGLSQIQLKARNGGTVTSMGFACTYLGNGYS
jgi:hypothetical protein